MITFVESRTRLEQETIRPTFREICLIGQPSRMYVHLSPQTILGKSFVGSRIAESESRSDRGLRVSMETG